MITGIGVDLVDVARIDNALNKGDAFRDKVFSEKEIAYCTSQGITSFAGRFAAKEAFLKAIGTGWRGNIHLNEIEILNDEMGKPGIQLLGTTREELAKFSSGTIHLSISHTASAATAFVVIED